MVIPDLASQLFPEDAGADEPGSNVDVVPEAKDAQPIAAAATAPAALMDYQLEPTHEPLAAAATQLMKENNNEKDESPDEPAEDEPPNDIIVLDDLVDGDEVMENKRISQTAAAPDAAATAKAGSPAMTM